MKKSTITRPVSPKSYARFVERINLVIADEAKRLSMLSALDRYLSGDRATYAEGLTPDCALAFEMLRYDIDLAIIRSSVPACVRVHVKMSQKKTSPHPRQPRM